MWTNKTGGSDVVVTPAYGGVEVSGVAIFLVPRSLEGRPGFEQNNRGAEFQLRGLETISMLRRRGRGPEAYTV